MDDPLMVSRLANPWMTLRENARHMSPRINGQYRSCRIRPHGFSRLHERKIREHDRMTMGSKSLTLSSLDESQ